MKGGRCKKNHEISSWRIRRSEDHKLEKSDGNKNKGGHDNGWEYEECLVIQGKT